MTMTMQWFKGAQARNDSHVHSNCAFSDDYTDDLT